MQAEERQFLIEQHLQKVEFASLEELSERVDVSVSTVRRDLTLLEAKGALRREGGTSPRTRWDPLARWAVAGGGQLRPTHITLLEAEGPLNLSACVALTRQLQLLCEPFNFTLRPTRPRIY